MHRLALPEIIARLEAAQGTPLPPPPGDPWRLVLWENVAYLADDERRDQAMRMLEQAVGIAPEHILAATQDQLEAITGHGILAATFAEKLRSCARIALEQFDGDVRTVLKLPAARARKALRMFPGIGDPGAEKILVFCRAQPVLALESNGVRALVRLGFGEDTKNYATTYRLVQQAIEPELHRDYDWLIKAHQVLRRHGQELCKRTKPLCRRCPLAAGCGFYLAANRAQ
jgi:endonuclease III